jgi:hypothetical protein
MQLRTARVVLLSAALLLATAGAAPTVASARTKYPDCNSIPRYKPSGLDVYCTHGDQFYVHHIHWTRWRRSSARGSSTRAWANDCEVSCAAGHWHRFKVRLELLRVRTCASGRIFTRMRVTVVGANWWGPRTFTQPLTTFVLCTDFSIKARAGQSRHALFSGSVRALGPFHPHHNPRYAAAIRAFGYPDTERDLDAGNTCIVRWKSRGLTISFANYGGYDACDPDQGLAQWASIARPTRARWFTSRGLRLGSHEHRLRDLYPRATHHGRWWWLVTGRTNIGCTKRCPYPYAVLAARVRHHKVAAFSVWIGAAGD